MPGADEKFKLSLIEALGNAKAADIVPDLLDILTTRPFVTTAARTLMEEKICIALGAIGSPEAIPDLSEIAEPKSFFRISSYPKKVKAAAARVLESIRKKQAEAMPKFDIPRLQTINIKARTGNIAPTVLLHIYTELGGYPLPLMIDVYSDIPRSLRGNLQDCMVIVFMRCGV